ncbi:MAG: hypothetical protein HC863_02950, partial [Myxococcales bacterium]|nr:hypothetical protein [Myxococcales bacterium]
MAKALEAPLKQIAENAGMEGGVVVEKVRGLKGANGLNAATGDYEDLVKIGVIDAAGLTVTLTAGGAILDGNGALDDRAIGGSIRKADDQCAVASGTGFRGWLDGSEMDERSVNRRPGFHGRLDGGDGAAAGCDRDAVLGISKTGRCQFLDRVVDIEEIPPLRRRVGKSQNADIRGQRDPGALSPRQCVGNEDRSH